MELKPCPVCGGEGTYEIHEDGWDTFRRCWAKFLEEAPEWWWDVLTDRPRAQQTEEAPTLF